MIIKKYIALFCLGVILSLFLGCETTPCDAKKDDLFGLRTTYKANSTQENCVAYEQAIRSYLKLDCKMLNQVDYSAVYEAELTELPCNNEITCSYVLDQVETEALKYLNNESISNCESYKQILQLYINKECQEFQAYIHQVDMLPC